MILSGSTSGFERAAIIYKVGKVKQAVLFDGRLEAATRPEDSMILRKGLREVMGFKLFHAIFQSKLFGSQCC